MSVSNDEFIGFQREWMSWIVSENTYGLQKALDEGQDVDEILSDAFPEERWTGLSLAAERNAMMSLEFLVKDGAADKNKVDGAGLTPLARAAAKGNGRATQFLLASRAKVDTRCGKNATALHHAVSGQSLTVVEMLLKAGADPNAADDDRNTPMHMAARGSSARIAAALRKAGGNPDMENAAGKTPLKMARDGEVREALESGGPDTNGGFNGVVQAISSKLNTGGGQNYVPPIPPAWGAGQSTVTGGGNLGHGYDHDLSEAKKEGYLLAEGRIVAESGGKRFECEAYVIDGGFVETRDEDGRLEVFMEDEAAEFRFVVNGGAEVRAAFDVDEGAMMVSESRLERAMRGGGGDDYDAALGRARGDGTLLAEGRFFAERDGAGFECDCFVTEGGGVTLRDVDSMWESSEDEEDGEGYMVRLAGGEEIRARFSGEEDCFEVSESRLRAALGGGRGPKGRV